MLYQYLLTLNWTRNVATLLMKPPVIGVTRDAQVAIKKLNMFNDAFIYQDICEFLGIQDVCSKVYQLWCGLDSWAKRIRLCFWCCDELDSLL